MKPFLLGVLASFFFSSSFIINRSLGQAGGHWAWSGSLRFFYMLPILLFLVHRRGNLGSVLRELRNRPGIWLLWSTVGFGLFYAPLCFSAIYAPAWLSAGTWQLTIVAGALMTPFLGNQHKIPRRELVISVVILVGVYLMQRGFASAVPLKQALLGTLPVILGTIAYPLGNRKMMQVCEGRLDTTQRVLGMTIMSLPFWIAVSVFAGAQGNFPGRSQILQTGLVALSSGIVATLLFFKATDLVKHLPGRLAAVEATQAGELVFSVLGGYLFLAESFPRGEAFAGFVVIIGGMILLSFGSGQPKETSLAPRAPKQIPDPPITCPPTDL